MPLDDDDQQTWEEIEAQLRADDPAFARKLDRVAPPPTPRRRFRVGDLRDGFLATNTAVRLILLAAAGILLLRAGNATQEVWLVLPGLLAIAGALYLGTVALDRRRAARDNLDSDPFP